MPGKPPTTYDEITRRTVPDPDSSFRPTPEQLEDTRRGIRAMDDEERVLLVKVQAALAGIPGVAVEVEGRRVTLSGAVADAATMQRARDAASAVRDIDVVDQMHVAS